MKTGLDKGKDVTVQTGLSTCCTDRKKMIQECKNPIAAGKFQWMLQVTGHEENSSKNVVKIGFCL